MRYKDLKIKIFADGADKKSILELNQNPIIKGFTTNPTLMRKAGVADYEQFAKDILLLVKNKPISFEVFADDFEEMENQARYIASWGTNVYVKIPITNTQQISSFETVKKLSAEGIKINVTAILTIEQVRHIVPALNQNIPAVISVFAGRIADTGRDPVKIMQEAKQSIPARWNVELLWASPREVLNVFQAEEAGCDIITATSDILNKLTKVGYDLTTLSLDTVKMFYTDAVAAGYKINTAIHHDEAYINTYLNEIKTIIEKIDRQEIENMITCLRDLQKRKGRLFILGIGGSAANASHAANDFRKMCKIESYAPTDNVAELTAWTNDKSFEVIFSEWLRESHVNANDALLVLSVGGGTATTSKNLVNAMEYAKSQGATIMGIVSRDGGMTKKLGDITILVPVVDEKRITPHAEAWQGIIWHLISNALMTT